MVDGLSSIDDALLMLYRTRQEVFIAEGLRMVDMGIKLVISETEELQNANISSGGMGTAPQIPTFIEAVKDQLDVITYEPGSCEANTAVDVNAILVSNKTDDLAVPLF